MGKLAMTTLAKIQQTKYQLYKIIVQEVTHFKGMVS